MLWHYLFVTLLEPSATSEVDYASTILYQCIKLLENILQRPIIMNLLLVSCRNT